MSKLKSLLFLFTLTSIFISVGCKKDNKTPDNKKATTVDTTSNLYDFTIHGGHFDGQKFSGKMEALPSAHTTSKVFFLNKTSDIIEIKTFLTNDNDLSITCYMLYDKPTKTVQPLGPMNDSTKSNLNILFLKYSSSGLRNYFSQSGTISIANVHIVDDMNDGGHIGFQLAFDGTFNNYVDGDVEISGSMLVRLPHK